MGVGAACTSKPSAPSTDPGPGSTLVSVGDGSTATTFDASDGATGSTTFDAGDELPPIKDGASGGVEVSGLLCGSGEFAVETLHLLASGPTPAFVSAYNQELAKTASGGFALQLSDVRLGNLKATLSAAGCYGTSTLAVSTESFASFTMNIGNARELSVVATESPFHIAFTRDARGVGDILVGGLALTGTFAADCSSATLNLTLFIPASESSSKLGGVTIGTLLGTPTASVGGLSFDGWAVPLSGTVSSVMLK